MLFLTSLSQASPESSLPRRPWPFALNASTVTSSLRRIGGSTHRCWEVISHSDLCAGMIGWCPLNRCRLWSYGFYLGTCEYLLKYLLFLFFGLFQPGTLFRKDLPDMPHNRPQSSPQPLPARTNTFANGEPPSYCSNAVPCP